MMPITARAKIHGAKVEARVGEERQAEAQEAVRAHLQQHAGQDHGARGGRLDVGVGQPGVEREHRHLDGEGEGEGQEQQVLGAPRAAARSCARTGRSKVYVAGGGAVLEVEGQDGDQHEERAGHRVEDELDRRVDAAGPAPDPDDEVHRDQHRLPEDVEEEEVERDEDAQHARLEQQHGDHELLQPRLDGVPGRQRASGMRKVVSSTSRRLMPSMPDVIADAQRRHPRPLLHELEVRRARRRSASTAASETTKVTTVTAEGRRRFSDAAPAARQERDEHGADGGQERDRARGVIAVIAAPGGRRPRPRRRASMVERVVHHEAGLHPAQAQRPAGHQRARRR